MWILVLLLKFVFFFFNDTATTEIYTLSLHDALPISPLQTGGASGACLKSKQSAISSDAASRALSGCKPNVFSQNLDRKSTRLNSSHDQISYAVFCLKKKKHANSTTRPSYRSRTHTSL